ncbi:unnamed protein product, partial [Discosporangium mesarthrocarpum]
HFPRLAKVAWRVLATPSTQAESERIFSTLSLTVTLGRHNQLDPDKVYLLIFQRKM